MQFLKKKPALFASNPLITRQMIQFLILMTDISPIKVARSGNVIGEFPPYMIEGKLRDGTLQSSDHYWKNGMTSWTLLGPASDWRQTSQAPQAHEPPPIPTQPTQPHLSAHATSVARHDHRTLHGRVLGYTFQTSSGFISSSDGLRYSFNAGDWLSSDKTPTAGMEVEFLSNGTQAKSIFVVSKLAPGSNSAGISASHYRSSDNALVSGVCAGLAHKWKTDTILIRIVMLFVPLGWILYIVASMSWEERPTKNV